MGTIWPEIPRRQFVTVLAKGAVTLGIGSVGNRAHAAAAKRKMLLSSACGRIGVRVRLAEAVELAARYGFEAVSPTTELGGLSDQELRSLLSSMKAKNIVFGAAALPVDFRGARQKFDAGMKRLPALAAAFQKAGVRRIGTYIRPGHDQLTYRRNFRQHVHRLRQVATVLEDAGLRFGLEYVGPKTSWTRQRFPFIHTMVETKELIAEIDRPNVGFVLDSWHWYTAGETAEDLLTLTNEDIVAVDLNDAPAGIPRDEQVDSHRELPCATGVIDLGTFLDCLNRLGYDGPVRAEPFNAALRALPKEKAVAATAAAMKKALALIQP
ncbi:MAG TPA: sugar phosphate isomerase/epimerase [Planctomycetaceae bacterium]|nr:sugar phosphate isomerase/epimerase [Planctomycetaceae bacterium]